MASSITQKYIPHLNLTVFTATGNLTYSAQMKVLVQFYDGTPTQNVIWDLRRIEGNRITNSELQFIIKFMNDNKHRRTSGKTALVTASTLDFGIARMGSIISEVEELPVRIEAFRSMDEAMIWIETQ